MNTKTPKKHSGAGKSKLSNGEAEVFVIPPNLLEKLGIKLDNIECSIKGPNNDQNTDITKLENVGCVQENKEESDVATEIQNTHSGKESSILETAILMKKSVFLSPTFIPTVANAIPGEVEISSTSKTSEDIKDKTVCTNCNTELEVFDYNLSVKHQNNQSLIGINDVEQQGEKISLRKTNENNKEIINQSYEVPRKSLHTTNNNDKKFTSILLSAKEKQNKPKNKINIVSEQIVNLPELKLPRKSNLDKNGLIPVPVNTIITPKNCYGLDSKNRIIKEFPRVISTTDLDSKHCDNLCQISQNISDHQIDFQTHNKTSVLGQTTGEMNISNDLNPSVLFTNINVNETREITGSNNKIALNKSPHTNGVDNFIKEGEILNPDDIIKFYSTNNEIINKNLDMSLNNNTIEGINCDSSSKQTPYYNDTSNFETTFVKGFNNIERNYISDEIVKHSNSLNSAINETPNNIADLNFMMCEDNMSKDKYIENQIFDNFSSYSCLNNSEYLLANSGNGLIKSKSCIQGVEKPGGDKKESNQKPIVLKTYEKKRSRKGPDLSMDSNYQLNLVRKSYRCVDCEIEPTKLNTTCKTHNYCICEDFGKLTYYDNNDAYEHIHFWRTESVTCEPELVFNMYSDGNKLQDDIGEKIDEISFLENETSQICWNGIFDFKTSDGSTPIETNLLEGTSYSRMKYLENIESHVINKNREMDKNKLIAAENIHTNNLVAEENQSTLSSLKDANIKECVPTKIIQPEQIIFNQSNMEIETESYSLANTAVVEERQNKQHFMKSAEVEKQPNTNDGDTNKIENNSLNVPVVAEVIQPIMGVIHTIKIERIDTANQIQTNSKNNYNLKDMESTKIKCSSQNVSNILLNNSELPIEQESNKLIGTEQSDNFVPQQITENELRCLKNYDRNEICTYASKGKGKKRRKSDIASEKLSDLTGPPRKKDLKCGICDEMVAEVDWERHISEEHDYLAWKAGNSIDFQDQDLLKKIKRKLKEQGVIKCCVCNIKINEFENCITHVQQCIQSMNMSRDLNKKEDSIKTSGKSMKCGVCKEEVKKKHWVKHIFKKHNYLAWRNNEPPLDLKNEDEIITYLRDISRDQGGLTCSHCNLYHKHSLKSAAIYLNHIKSCENVESSCMQVDDNEGNQSTSSENIVVKCGVCLKNIETALWTEHTMKEHNYLAWKDGEPSLDLEDEEVKYKYLYALVKKVGCLVCGKCGIKRKYARSYLDHFKNCDGTVPSKVKDSMSTSFSSDVEKTLDSSQLELNEPKHVLRKDLKNSTEKFSDALSEAKDEITSMDVEANNSTIDNTLVKCGVCQKDVENSFWINHIMKEHNYLAWKDGEPSLDLEDKEAEYQCLVALAKKVGRLVCGKCGYKRKYARNYLDHIKTCDGTIPSKKDEPVNTSVASDVDKSLDVSQLELKESRNVIEDSKYAPSQEVDVISSSFQVESNKGILSGDAVNTAAKCGVCQKDIELADWTEHIMKEHNYLAWKDGEPRLDLEDEEAKYKYLYALVKKVGFLVCGKCGRKRKYARSYLDHFKNCDGTVPSKVKDPMNTSFASDVEKTLNSSQLELNESKRVLRKDSQDNIEKLSDAISQSADVITSMDVESNNGNISSTIDTIVKCGVCQKDVEISVWINHIMKEHNYLAWKDGDPSLDLKDKEAKYQHLFALAKKVGRLVCGKCGYKRKYARNYLDHIKICDGTIPSKKDKPVKTSVASDVDKTLDVSQLELKESGNVTDDSRYMPTQEVDVNSSIQVEKNKGNLSGDIANSTVKCGVCQKEIDLASWTEHIMKEHNYLAWKDGEPSLDLEDEEAKYKYLYALVKKVGFLVCGKCGIKRKYARSYLDHFKNCDGMVPSKVRDAMNTSFASDVEKTLDSSQLELNEPKHILRKDSKNSNGKLSDTLSQAADVIMCMDVESNNGNISSTKIIDNPVVKCGVCQKNVETSVWNNHIMKEHNYLAWKDGEPSLDLEDEEAKYKYLYALVKKVGCLVCGKCGFKRKYARLYLDHINECDGTAPCKVNDPNASFVSDVDKTLDSSHLEPKASRDDTERRKSTLSRKAAATLNKNRREQVVDASSSANDIVKCGVCQIEVGSAQWSTHLKQHNYLAWKEGESSINLDDDEQVRNHLCTLLVQYEDLTCSKCGLKRKQVKRYLDHIKKCDGMSSSNSFNVSCISDVNSTLDASQIEIQIKNEVVERDVSSRKRKRTKVNCVESEELTVKMKEEPPASPVAEGSRPNTGSVKCGVCNKTVLKSQWYHHIEREHFYMAWKEGEPALDLEDKEEVWQHLNDLSKMLGGLVCAKCNYRRKYVKVFLEHINSCNGIIEVPIEYDETNKFAWDFKLHGDVKCGVCSKVVQGKKWFTHIQVSHNYMAWMDGEEQLNVNVSDSVKTHLGNILRFVQDLKCIKCGFSRRNAKAYMLHMNTCSFDSNVYIVEDKNELLQKNEGRYECAVCHQLIEPKKWQQHAMNEHYNIAWVVGDPPIDLISPYGTEKQLKEYWKKVGKLVCKVCGERRSSCMGFYVHIITCGKTDEETEMYKNTCEICGNKYLIIYKSQHMTAHREAEYAKERKKLAQETRINFEGNDSDDEPLGRRKAAEKAKTVIEDYKTNLKQEVYAHNCSKCSFASDSKKKFDSHTCKKRGYESNSDVSENELGEADDSGSEVSFSEECNEALIKEIIPIQRKSSWLPFKVIDPKFYMQKSAEQFCAMHFTNETLFPQWRTCKYNKVSEEQVSEYLPKVQQSCKVKLNKEWTTLKQFEAKKIHRGFSFFTGGSTQCMAWVPLRPDHDQDKGGNYLAVSCHQTGDSPRFNYDEIHSHVGLIQIWHFADFKIGRPKFVLGLAHDYGTVWDIAWCPSGARDKSTFDGEDKTWTRLGLLAAACSNGKVYIFSVPYPATIETTDKLLILKLKPVAELRLNTKSERKLYQATAISWSKKKGHSIVVVGYSDGTIAYYDVSNNSPLVQTVEDEVTIFYPYLDERLLNACVSGLDTMPANGLSEVAICGSSSTGAMTAAAPRGSRVVSRLPAAVSVFAPIWPVTLLSGQDAIINQTPNEMDWSGTGRRVGNLQHCCACIMCGRVVLFNPPVLRSLRLFPPSIDLKRKPLGVIDMIPLGKKRKLQSDEYATRMEPFTYEETIDKYGIEFVLPGQNEKPMYANKDTFPERYPLADVTSMAFCPSVSHHNNLAVATHSGIVFIILNA